MRTGTPPTDFCSVTRAELFGPARPSASAFFLCSIAGSVGSPGDCSVGALAPRSTLVPPRMSAREPISRLIILGRQREEFSLDLTVGALKVEKRSALRERAVFTGSTFRATWTQGAPSQIGRASCRE